MPFHLEKLGYHDVAALTGWLLFAYVRLRIYLFCWLLMILQSGGLVLCNYRVAFLYMSLADICPATIPIAMLSERYNTRKIPLIIGLVLLTGSQVLLMEAPNYAVMCVARVLQGISSSMVWVVGLALL